MRAVGVCFFEGVGLGVQVLPCLVRSGLAPQKPATNDHFNTRHIFEPARSRPGNRISVLYSI